MRATSNELFPLEKSNIVFARSYAEAAGFIAAHKAGILFESITSIVKSISITELS